MEDAELRNILFSIQGSIAGFQNDMSDVKNDIADMKTDIANMKADITNMKTDITNMKADITNMKSDIVQLKGSVKTIELNWKMKLTEKYLPYLMHVWMSFAIERRIRKLERKFLNWICV